MPKALLLMFAVSLNTTLLIATEKTIEIDKLLPDHNNDLGAALSFAIQELHSTGGRIFLNSLGEGINGGDYQIKTNTPITRKESDHRIVITTHNGDLANVKQASAQGDILKFQNASNISVENLRLIGKSGTKGCGVGVNKSKDIAFHNIDVRNTDSVGIALTDAKNINIEQTNIRDSRGHGIRISDCEAVTLKEVDIVKARGYGIGVQNGHQVSRDLKILDSRIIRSSGDGIDIKGQRVDAGPLVFIDGLDVVKCGGGKSAALDLRGHVNVKNVNIKLNPGTTGLRFRVGEDIGNYEKNNGWAGYGLAENVNVETADAGGAGIVVFSGKVTLSDCSVNGPVKTKIKVFEWANKEEPVVLKNFTINETEINNLEKYLSSGGSLSKEPKLVFD